MRRTVLCALLTFSVVRAAGAQDTSAQPNTSSPSPPLLGFCALPVRPSCIDSADTYLDAAKRESCNGEVERYVKFVFAYRVCLNAEMERAVRETNSAIFLHKCRMANRKDCP